MLYQSKHEETSLQSENPPDFSESGTDFAACPATSHFLRTCCLVGMYLNGEVAEWSKAPSCKGWYALQGASEVRILPLSAFLTGVKSTNDRLIACPE